MRILLLLIMLLSFAPASLVFTNSYFKEVTVLKSLDIDESFLKDPAFIEMQSDLKSYHKKHFFASLDNAYIYIPVLKNMIKESGIPSVFLYMAMVESNFSTKALSNKKAVGLWQFLPSTAMKFGLTINKYVDERMDPIKSTSAAVGYIKHLYGLFGKWYLAALAYNCGEGKVANAIAKAGTDNLGVLLDPKKKYLPKESRLFLRKIISLALMANSEKFMLKDDFDYLLNRGGAYPLATIKVPGGENLGEIARMLQMNTEDLRKLNAHLKYDIVPPNEEQYEIYIPYIKLASFKESYNPAQAESRNLIVHKVSKGETLVSIGKKYHISHEIIKDFNRLKSDQLQVNQSLVIPLAEEKLGPSFDKEADAQSEMM